MARKFTYADVRNWRVVNNAGKTLRDGDNKPLNHFDGYRNAQAAATKLGGYAVRV
ncbi:hypothetical protein ACFUOZ_00595 [Paenarthrobacter sp. NPDC057355]|uniref:hypothetical protein n=1 Tax=Paenarthrobacter sp. NPDC057355 TaxID=3346105 RepID=UPI003643B268